MDFPIFLKILLDSTFDVTFTTRVRYFEMFTGHGHGVSTSERNISFTILGRRVTR